MHFEHEAVELGFGQRIGALLLDRVLGGQHQERSGSAKVSSPRVTWRSCMASSKRGLDLGRGAVDLVGQDQVAEDRAPA